MKNVGTKRLDTDRLILRRFTMEDAEDMFNNWASDDEVTKFLTWPTHKSIEVTKKVLSDWIPRYERDDYYNWAIELKENGQAVGHVIGNISAVDLKERTECAIIGYCMGREYWGRGIMPEALGEVIAFFFDEVELNRVEAHHDVNNPKSGRVMEKAGMRYEGTLRQGGRNNLGISDLVIRAVLKDDV